MVKAKKKGESGAVTNYIPRTQALRKLQLKLPDFRRLCILKGIYPREPPNRKKVGKGSSAPRTYYWIKDIAFLAHEPLLQKFREYKVFARKLRKALGKHQISVARSLEQNRPTYTLDHLVRERYPSFVDAVRDLDDALSMLFLFARMPQTNRFSADMVSRCARLCAEFQLYLIATRSLRKVFLSVKGVYYQAEVAGQVVTWVVPYQFTQEVPSDVDYRIMVTFLEFYATLLAFVNYKLYSDENLAYPPTLDIGKEAGAAGLSAFLLQPKGATGALINQRNFNQERTKRPRLTVQRGLHKFGWWQERFMDLLESSGVLTTGWLDATVLAQTVSALNRAASAEGNVQPSASSAEMVRRLKSLPTKIAQLARQPSGDESGDAEPESGSVVPVGDEEFSSAQGQEQDTGLAITHQIVDRPKLASMQPSRRYVQPQWVFDCVNAQRICVQNGGTILRLIATDKYGPGKSLPPHLSPFELASGGGYVPPEAKELLEGELISADDRKDAVASEPASSTSSETGLAPKANGKTLKTLVGSEKPSNEKDADADADGEPDSDVDAPSSEDDEDDEMTHQEELAAEAAGLSYSAFKAQQHNRPKADSGMAAARAKSAPKSRGAMTEEQEERALAKTMMRRRDRRLLKKIEKTKSRKTAEVQKLQERRAAIDSKTKAAQSVPAAGKASATKRK